MLPKWAVNLVCLRLLSHHTVADVNVKASKVFTSNDSIAAEEGRTTSASTR